MTRHETRQARHRERALAFAQCEFCSYNLATGEGERSCHYFECPYLPEELSVTCPTCLYNFYTGDGNPECADPPTCRFAKAVAPGRVATVREWFVRHGNDPETGLPVI